MGISLGDQSYPELSAGPDRADLLQQVEAVHHQLEKIAKDIIEVIQ